MIQRARCRADRAFPRRGCPYILLECSAENIVCHPYRLNGRVGLGSSRSAASRARSRRHGLACEQHLEALRSVGQATNYQVASSSAPSWNFGACQLDLSWASGSWGDAATREVLWLWLQPDGCFASKLVVSSNGTALAGSTTQGGLGPAAVAVMGGCPTIETPAPELGSSSWCCSDLAAESTDRVGDSH